VNGGGRGPNPYRPPRSVVSVPDPEPSRWVPSTILTAAGVVFVAAGAEPDRTGWVLAGLAAVVVCIVIAFWPRKEGRATCMRF